MTPRILAPALAGAALLGMAGCEPGGDPADESRLRAQFNLYDFEQNFGYAQSVKVGRTLYVSATMAVDAEGRLVGPGDMAAQLDAAYLNIGRTLAANGAAFEHVVRENLYTTDMDALLEVAAIRFDYYPRNALPAATWVQVERLIDPGFLVAIEVTAELP